jgi:hypothetical protein
VVLTPLSFHLTPDEHPLIRGPAVLLPDGVTAGSGPRSIFAPPALHSTNHHVLAVSMPRGS